MMKRYLAVACLLVNTGCIAEESFQDAEAPDADEEEIVGGTNANISEFPWQISFQTKSGFHFCGGSILNSRYILTAQHCVAGESAGEVTSPATVRVAAGSSKLSTMASTGQIRSVEDVIPIPGFITPEVGKDIALLRLSTALTFNTNVQQIAIATAADASAGLTDPGDIATVTGWGSLSSGGSSPDTLQKVNVPIVSQAAASAAYPPGVTADQIGAGDLVNGGEDSCQGDSGGPLVVTKGTGKILAGVVSYGQGCALAQFPGMYARVSESVLGSFINKIASTTPTTLTNQTAQSGSTNVFKHFSVTVPAGKTALNVNLSGGTGDADLYVRQTSQPTTTTFNCRPFLGGNNESCSIGNPGAGTWFVSIRGFSNYSGATLKASVY
jgi:trypsin